MGDGREKGRGIWEVQERVGIGSAFTGQYTHVYVHLHNINTM